MSKKCLAKDCKLCPFQSSPDEEVECSEKCALYRGKKKDGFNCPLIELSSISWLLKGAPQKRGGGGYSQY